MPDDTDDEELWIQQFVDKVLFESDIRVFIHEYMMIHKLPEKVRIDAEDYHQTPVYYINLNKLNTLFHQQVEEPLIQSGHIVISGMHDIHYDWMIDGKTRVMTIGSVSHALRCSRTESIISSLYTDHGRPFRSMSSLHGLLLFKTEDEANAYLHERLEHALKNINRVQGASNEPQ